MPPLSAKLAYTRVLLMVLSLSARSADGFAVRRAKFRSITDTRTPRQTSICGTLDENFPPNASSQSIVDTSCFEDHLDTIQSWLSTLTKVERSEPEWLAGEEVMSISPSMLIQEHLDALYPGFNAPILFPSEANRSLFDFQWRHACLTSLPQSELETVLSSAMSNSHPLSMYLAAIPPNTCLDLHAHPAIELFVSVVGKLNERKAMEVKLPRDMLCRRIEMEVGGMGGQFNARPSAEDLVLVGSDISDRMVFEDSGEQGVFAERQIDRGEVELNDVGSVHQSYTTDSGCLLFVLGAKVFGRFRKGQFLQRTGIECLESVDHLIE